MINPLTCPVPTTFTSPSGATVRVLARSWGLTLTHTSGSGWGSGYWSSSSGGGQSLRASDDTVAQYEFDQLVAGRQRYWHRVIGPESIIVAGVHYRDGGYAADTHRPFLGFAGRLWGVRRLTDGHTWQTNNLWHQGDLPSELGLADTHEFVTPTPTLPLSQPLPTAQRLPTLSPEQQSVVDHQ